MTNSISSPVPYKSNRNYQKSMHNEKASTLTLADLHYSEGKKNDIINKQPIVLGKNNSIMASIISAL